MLLISWVVVSYFCGRQAELSASAAPGITGSCEPAPCSDASLGLQHLAIPATSLCLLFKPACLLTWVLPYESLILPVDIEVVNLLVLSVTSSWCMDDIWREKIMCWKLYVRFSEGLPQFTLHRCERFRVSWHRAPGLPQLCPSSKGFC